MKRIPIGFLLLALFIGPVSAAAGERILSYDAFIRVEPSGAMEVSETISVVCEGDQIKHGIYRDFPTRYEDAYGNTVRVAFTVTDVRRDGRIEPWHTEDQLNGVRVYVGDKDTILAPGEYAYVITYLTDRQLGFFDQHDELYWNVTGNGWSFAIEQVRATVELPPGASVLSAEAYTGPQGAKGKDFTAGRDDQGRAVFATTRSLNPREGLTIVVTWPKGFVRAPSRTVKAAVLLKDNASTGAGLAGLMLLLGYYLLAWLRVGRDPARGVIIPQFDAPPGFSPEAVRYVMHMGFDQKTFAAAIVHMAVKGFITIDQDASGEYTFVKRNSDEGRLTKGEKRIAQQLFAGGTSLAVKTENHTTLQKAIKDLQRSLAVEYEKIYFVTNATTLVPGIVLSVLALVAVVLLGRSKPLAGFMAIWLSGWTAGCAMLVFQAYKAWKAALSMQSSRFRNLGGAVSISLFAIPFLGFEVFGFWAFAGATSRVAVVLILGIVLLNIVFYHLMKSPTIKGRRIMDQIEGLKLYLSVAEQDRLNQLNPPEKTPEVFEKFLPYALALDVEQAWCEQFADVLDQARLERHYAPDWYTGGRLGAGMSGLASGLGSLSSSISAAASPPGSSSGGGGGGSSGGGGGGGGGGGW